MMQKLFFQSLSFRLKSLTVLWLVAALFAIAFTLLLSWQMQGAGAAINDAGSLRMQTYRLGLLLNNHAKHEKIQEHLRQFEHTLVVLQTGDPERPLLLPNDSMVQSTLQQLKNDWYQVIKPHFETSLQQASSIEQPKIQAFIQRLDAFTQAIEKKQAQSLYLLRVFQMSLLGLVLISALIMVYLLNIWVLIPLAKLQTGVSAIHAGQLGIQVVVDKVSEFAQLDKGFNQMSTHLQHLYQHLEQEVLEKTQDLAHKTDTLETLYSFSNFLNQTHHPADACAVFLEKIMTLIPAAASSIRLIDFKRKKLDLIAQIGLPETLQNATACQHLDDCFCGQAVKSDDWQPIRLYHSLPEMVLHTHHPHCHQFGFYYLRVFHIRYKESDLGVLTLYFQQEQDLSNLENLLDSLCNQLGSAVNNLRLSEESRQLAVMQERNLMAQGLHDSIAQTLNFLNLQTQMLERSLKNNNTAEINESLQFIKDGVKECYDDVRELLLNFRTKITRKEFAEAVDTLAQRFKQQTHCEVDIVWRGDGAPLTSEQQLQFIFILQESLSNIRKHAAAKRVRIVFDNQADFVMNISDDGQGFDTAKLHALSGSHVGLGIMRERAQRIHAQFDLQSQPQQGTQISLRLPEHERVLE